MRKRYGIADIPNINDQAVFFDANVVIYLFFPTTPTNRYSAQYSIIFHQLLRHKLKLIIDVTVISEIINAIIRISYDKYKLRINSQIPFKQYRNSPEGTAELKYIHSVILSKIFTRFEVIGSCFTKSDLENILLDSPYDFNDKLIAETCHRNDFILLTNDKDFTNTDVDIISCNPNIV